MEKMKEKEAREEVEKELGIKLPDLTWDFVCGNALDELDDSDDSDDPWLREEYTPGDIRRMVVFARKYLIFRSASESGRARAPKPSSTGDSPPDQGPLDEGWSMWRDFQVKIMQDQIQKYRYQILGQGPFQDLAEAERWLGQNKEARLKLERLTLILADRCGWEKQSTRRYLLTGELPQPAPLSAEIRAELYVGYPLRIILRVDPRVRAEEVEAFYRYLIHYVRKTLNLNVSHKAPSKALDELTRLVLLTPDWSWQDRFETFNSKFPQWRYRWKDAKSMATAFNQVLRKAEAPIKLFETFKRLNEERPDPEVIEAMDALARALATGNGSNRPIEFIVSFPEEKGAAINWDGKF